MSDSLFDPAEYPTSAGVAQPGEWQNLSAGAKRTARNKAALEPEGAGVVIRATHSCMAARGALQPASSMQTQAFRGSLSDSERALILAAETNLPDIPEELLTVPETNRNGAWVWEVAEWSRGVDRKERPPLRISSQSHQSPGPRVSKLTYKPLCTKADQ